MQIFKCVFRWLFQSSYQAFGFCKQNSGNLENGIRVIEVIIQKFG